MFLKLIGETSIHNFQFFFLTPNVDRKMFRRHYINKEKQRTPPPPLKKETTKQNASPIERVSTVTTLHNPSMIATIFPCFFFGYPQANFTKEKKMTLRVNTFFKRLGKDQMDSRSSDIYLISDGDLATTN